MSHKKRLKRLEEQASATDTLTQQVMDIWQVFTDITPAQADEIADTYRQRGITVLRWEDVFLRDDTE